MNDFTKEELIEMREYCNWGPDGVGHSDFRLNLWKKLESMIDHYCEPISKDNPMHKCIRCESKTIDGLYEIKYGLHNWFLCVECSPQFRDWVLDKHADNGCPWAKEHFKRKYGNKNDN